MEFPVHSQGLRPFRKNRRRTKVKSSTTSPLRVEGETETARTLKPKKTRKSPNPTVLVETRSKILKRSPRTMRKRRKSRTKEPRARAKTPRVWQTRKRRTPASTPPTPALANLTASSKNINSENGAERNQVFSSPLTL